MYNLNANNLTVYTRAKINLLTFDSKGNGGESYLGLRVLLSVSLNFTAHARTTFGLTKPLNTTVHIRSFNREFIVRF